MVIESAPASTYSVAWFPKSSVMATAYRRGPAYAGGESLQHMGNLDLDAFRPNASAFERSSGHSRRFTQRVRCASISGGALNSVKTSLIRARLALGVSASRTSLLSAHSRPTAARGPENNVWIVGDDHEVIVIDPAFTMPRWLPVRWLVVMVTAVLLTHGRHNDSLSVPGISPSSRWCAAGCA
jgi:hypothetical protein